MCGASARPRGINRRRTSCCWAMPTASSGWMPRRRSSRSRRPSPRLSAARGRGRWSCRWPPSGSPASRTRSSWLLVANQRRRGRAGNGDRGGPAARDGGVPLPPSTGGGGAAGVPRRARAPGPAPPRAPGSGRLCRRRLPPRRCPARASRSSAARLCCWSSAGPVAGDRPVPHGLAAAASGWTRGRRTLDNKKHRVLTATHSSSC